VITTDAPTVEDYVAVTGKPLTVAQHMIDSGTRFVCAYHDSTLEGVLWYVGDGVEWWTVGVHIIPSARAARLGTELRNRMVAECEKETLGTGRIFGVFTRDLGPFWESNEPTRINTRLVVGERRIVGLL
jgi:hypothetical protein